METFDAEIIILTKWQLCELTELFRLVCNMGYDCALIVHTWANQLLPQLLMEQFDTLSSYYRHIGHLHD